MAYVRTRMTKADTVSTALVEAYRDDQGRPRQRVLANLHGEPDTLSALAKVASMRDALRKEQEALAKAITAARPNYEGITQATLRGHQFSPAERKEIDAWLPKWDALVKRKAKVEATLAAIQKDGIAIKKHCTATPDEIQTAIQAYQAKRSKTEALLLGSEFMFKDAKAKLRRMQR